MCVNKTTADFSGRLCTNGSSRLTCRASQHAALTELRCLGNLRAHSGSRELALAPLALLQLQESWQEVLVSHRHPLWCSGNQSRHLASSLAPMQTLSHA